MNKNYFNVSALMENHDSKFNIMINWEKTNKELNRYDIKGNKPKVYVNCDICGKTRLLTIRVKRKVINNNLKWHCPKCVSQRESVRKKLSESTKKQWKNPEYKTKMNKVINSFSLEVREKLSKSTRKQWKSGRFEGMLKNRWKNPDYQNKMAIHRAKMPKVSTIQNKLYSILDNLNIKYYREYNDKPNDPQTIIGPYNFDCVIPSKKLLIECQGDYWHSLKKARKNDKAKATYIEKYYPDYELKYLWEHEFKNENEIIKIINHWINPKYTNITYKNIKIENITENMCRSFIYKYGKNPNVPKANYHGIYSNNILIAVSVFKNIGEYFDLCILCSINPYINNYFVKKCIEKFNYKKVTCDYKLDNFKFFKKTKPIYWYMNDEWVITKETVRKNAKLSNINENEYAKQNKYRKIYGKENIKYIYERR